MTFKNYCLERRIDFWQLLQRLWRGTTLTIDPQSPEISQRTNLPDQNNAETSVERTRGYVLENIIVQIPPSFTQRPRFGRIRRGRGSTPFPSDFSPCKFREAKDAFWQRRGKWGRGN